MTMEPGFYVVRRPSRGNGTRLHIESRPFHILSDEEWALAVGDNRTHSARRYAYKNDEQWRDYIKSQHPKDEVFIIERVTEE